MVKQVLVPSAWRYLFMAMLEYPTLVTATFAVVGIDSVVEIIAIIDACEIVSQVW
jgi:hypothetical protein